MRIDDITKYNDIPNEYVIGRRYHCSWAKKRGFVWVLVSFDINKDIAHMITPKTKKKMTTQLSSLRDINKIVLQNKIPRLDRDRI